MSGQICFQACLHFAVGLNERAGEILSLVPPLVPNLDSPRAETARPSATKADAIPIILAGVLLGTAAKAGIIVGGRKRKWQWLSGDIRYLSF